MRYIGSLFNPARSFYFVVVYYCMDLALVFSQLIRINGLDIWEGLAHMGCSREVYADALKTFCGDLEKKSVSLAGFVKKENWKDYTAAAHAIKGGLAGIGAWVLAQEIRELEEDSQKGNYDICRKNTGKVLKKIGNFAIELRSNVLFAEETTPKERVSLDYLKKRLNELYLCCFSGKSSEADALAKELKTKTCGKKIDALVGTICTHVENLDYHLVLQALAGQPFIKN